MIVVGKQLKRKFQNAIGDHGEILAMASFSRPVRGHFNRPLFRATHLGGKYPIVDLLVDILDPRENSIGFFFVQVKSTSGASARNKTLRIGVGRIKFNMLADIPVPTFLVGADISNEKVFLVAAHRPVRKGFRTITKRFDLAEDAIRVKLYKEVARYWQEKKNRVSKINTEFKNER